MRWFPILATPRILTMKNRWFRRGRSSVREYLALLVSLSMMVGIYFCTLSALRDTSKMMGGATLAPEVPLSMVLTTLLLMLLLSASVTAIGALFLSRDLDIILSSPLTPLQFVIGKASEVTVASSWMLVMFGIPSLVAFGQFFNAEVTFYLLAPFVCGALLLIPSVASILVATLFGALVPPNRGREVFLMLFMVSLALFFMYLSSPYGATHYSATQVAMPSSATVSFARFSSISNSTFLPSSFCAHALTDLMRGTIVSSLAAIALFGGVSVLLGAVTIVAIRMLYERAFSRAQSHTSGMKINSRSSQKMARILFPAMKQERRALVAKEFKVFSRDITHTVQLGMLLGICFVYLYNFRVLRSPDNLAPEFIRWWQAFLMLTNIALSAMVVTSICTRFVFPSVSLEGTSFWVLQCSPLTMREILRTKFRAWFVPLASIGSVVFISGALALNAEGPLVLASCIAGIILCYGLVGLSIGLGAIFSQFDWEYSAQVSTTLGSFLFMFSSALLLIIDMVPLGLMFVGYILVPEQPNVLLSNSSGVLISCLGSLLVINKLLAGWALAAGARSLQPK